MQLTSIETTPNPNSMKLNLDRSIEGKPVTYTTEQRGDSPEFIAKLLDIEGVKSIFVCNDFITLNRDPRADWRLILDAVTHVLPGAQSSDAAVDQQRQAGEHLGQVTVTVQTFRGIPIQVKAADPQGEKRIALDQRFNQAAQLVQDQSRADYLKERYWADWGTRYGSLAEVAAEVAEEIDGTIGNDELDRIIAKALGKSDETAGKTSEALIADLNDQDWHRRLVAVQELGTAQDVVPLLIGALKDENHQVRRLAAAAMGASGSPEAVLPLSEALVHDQSIGVRRTAGDALSDLGDVSAEPAVCQALCDANKLVRWRAARFLADVGTEASLPFLKAALDDPEFEVRLEIEAAIDRITGGKEGSMPAWKKILKNADLLTE